MTTYWEVLWRTQLLKKWFILTGFCLVSVYLLSYMLLTLMGGYELGKSGRFKRYNLPTHDIWTWQLHFGMDSLFHDHSTFIPSLYRPLLWFDRSVWHKELPMLRQNEDGEIVACPAPPLGRLHPRVQQGYKIMEK